MSTPSPQNEQKGQKNSPQKSAGSNKEDLIDYFKTHIRESISYIILILGIILLFFDRLYGGLLVGIVTGVYFGDDIVNYIKTLKQTFDKLSSSSDIAKHLITLGIAFAFLIAAPGIFLGAAIAIAIKMLFVG